jgi:hypothetical protein
MRELIERRRFTTRDGAVEAGAELLKEGLAVQVVPIRNNGTRAGLWIVEAWEDKDGLHFAPEREVEQEIDQEGAQ